MTKCIEDDKKPSASELDLKSGRITLLWPLTLHLEEPPTDASAVDYTADAFALDVAQAWETAGEGNRSHLWEPIADPLHHYPRPVATDFEGGGESDAYRQAAMDWENEAYAEAVYFHEFVQSFLYRKHERLGVPPFRLFRRSDIRKAEITWGDNGAIIKRVEIDRLNLYVFRTGVAVFVMDMVMPEIEKTAKSGWTLADYQDLHDFVRRAYTPFFTGKDIQRKNAYLVVKKIAWLDGKGEAIAVEGGGDLSFDLTDDMDQVTAYVGTPGQAGLRYPPVFRHWRSLLPAEMPLAPYALHQHPKIEASAIARNYGISEDDAQALKKAARWHHVVDERMPTLATVDVTDETGGSSRFHSIRRSDLVRLCFADARGGGYPGDPDFFARFDELYCYDRFKSWGTRFLVSGYSFVAVFGSEHAQHLHSHMKRHYFQMMIMAQLEVASLLSFSGQVSRAVEAFGSQIGEDAEIDFERAMAAIQEQFLLFVHRFRFTGVSNQIQGHELFDLLRKQLRSEQMFQDVKDEISVANDYLQARADRRTSDAGERLALIGAIAVPIGIVVSLLGMNFFFDSDIWGDPNLAINFRKFLDLLPAQGAVAGVVILFAGLVGRFVFGAGKKPISKALVLIRQFSVWMMWVGVVFAIGFALSAYGFTRPIDPKACKATETEGRCPEDKCLSPK